MPIAAKPLEFCPGKPIPNHILSSRGFEWYRLFLRLTSSDDVMTSYNSEMCKIATFSDLAGKRKELSSNGFRHNVALHCARTKIPVWKFWPDSWLPKSTLRKFSSAKIYLVKKREEIFTNGFQIR